MEAGRDGATALDRRRLGGESSVAGGKKRTSTAVPIRGRSRLRPDASRLGGLLAVGGPKSDFNRHQTGPICSHLDRPSVICQLILKKRLMCQLIVQSADSKMHEFFFASIN